MPVSELLKKSLLVSFCGSDTSRRHCLRCIPRRCAPSLDTHYVSNTTLLLLYYVRSMINRLSTARAGVSIIYYIYLKSWTMFETIEDFWTHTPWILLLCIFQTPLQVLSAAYIYVLVRAVSVSLASGAQRATNASSAGGDIRFRYLIGVVAYSYTCKSKY